MKVRQLVFASICGALYATIGWFTYLGIFAPVFGVVRFWPAVVVPGFFSVAFGPEVGALGAAIGIFISDMLVHGDPLLSLTVGVPSNFLGFYLMGRIAQWEGIGRSGLKLLTAIGALLTFVLIDYSYFYLLNAPPSSFDFAAALILGFAVSIPFLWGLLREDEKVQRMSLGANIGLLAGSIYIGVGVWLYSQAIALPPAVMSGQSKLPIAAALLLTLWTYATEIPFLLIVVPPLVKAVSKWLVQERGA